MHLTTAPLPIRILTHNIRYAASPPSPGEAPWPTRLPLLTASLHYHTRHATTLLCIQEALHHQLTSLLAALPGYSSVGAGRDDGHHAGEHCAVLYDTAVWTLRAGETVWLSESGAVGRKGWDAASVRTCAVAHLRHKESGKEVVVVTLHLDDQGVVARREGAKVVLRVAQGWMGRTAAGVVVAGDLNSEVKGEAWRVLAGEWEGGSPLRDARELVGEAERYGEVCTFTGFEGREEDRQRLDYVFVGMRSWWRVKGYAVLPNRFEDGVYHSDHRAVVVDAELV